MLIIDRENLLFISMIKERESVIFNLKSLGVDRSSYHSLLEKVKEAPTKNRKTFISDDTK
jgi:hypothetical protein